MHLNLITSKEASSEDTPNGRFYNIDGKSYPSITTILDATSDKRGLENWKLRVGTEVAEKKSRDSTKVGSELHLMCEDLLYGRKTEKSSPRAAAMFRGLSSVMRKRIDDVYAIECPLCSHSLKVAGRTDLIALFDSKKSVCDYKSNHGSDLKKDEYLLNYKLQSTFYGKAYEEMGYGKIEQGVLLIANVYCCQVVTFDLDEYFEELKSRITQYYLQNKCTTSGNLI